MERSPSLLKGANVAALIAVIAVNVLANTLPIGGYTTGELSAMYPNLFTPAGFAFSIWSLIYLLLIGFTIYQYAGGAGGDRAADLVGWGLVISSVFNVSWILAWHYRIVWLSVLIMIALLLTLIGINRRLEPGRRWTGFAGELFVSAPFSIYFGWISVAVIANVTAFLVSLGWEGGPIPATIWASLLIAVGTVLALVLLFLRRQYLYALVFVWAFVGIIAKRSVDPPADDGLVIIAAGFGILVILLGIVLLIARGDLRRSPSEAPPS